jgi:phosphate starvation-inducible PhoH-like protein
MRKEKTTRASVTNENPILKIKQQIKKLIGKEKLYITPKTDNQKKFIEAIQNNNTDYVVATGIAGSGKSFLAIIESLNLLLREDNNFTKLRIFKPLKQLQHEEIGTLPGGVEEKLEFVLMSYTMQLKKIINEKVLELLFKEGIIEIIPMGNIRGLSLDNINIFDEFQNSSIENAETTLTRLEEGSKMIIIGDIRQRDFKDKSDNGLMFLTEHFNDFDEKFQVINFTDEDCVRSKLIQRITKVFDENHKPNQEQKTFLTS